MISNLPAAGAVSTLTADQVETPPKRALGHIPALDGVRGLAAATVFFYHYGGGAQSPHLLLRAFGRTLQLGWSGVSLFFALSGFLITGILLRSYGKAHWWRTFYIRRSLRIFPLYYMALAGSMLIAAILGARSSSLLPAWPYYFYLQDLPLPVGGVYSTMLNYLHFWSLAVEEQFYLVWPFLLLFAFRRKLAAQLCLLAFICSLLFRISVFAFGLHAVLSDEFLLARVGELAAGAWLAVAIHGPESKRERLLSWATPVMAGALSGIAFLSLLTGETRVTDPWIGTLGLALFAVGFTALIASCLRPGMMQRAFANPILRWLGKISYGIYVYHLLLRPVFEWAARKSFPTLTGEGLRLWVAVLAGAGTLAVAAASFYTVERSFLKLKDKFAPASSL